MLYLNDAYPLVITFVFRTMCRVIFDRLNAKAIVAATLGYPWLSPPSSPAFTMYDKFNFLVESRCQVVIVKSRESAWQE